MNKIFLSLLIIVSLYATEANAKRKALLKDIPPILITDATPLKVIDHAIRISLINKDWSPISYNTDLPREILATLIVNSHSLTIKIQYDVSSISFSYEDSINLRYLEEDGKKYIHSAYHEWTEWLTTEIKRNLARSDHLAEISDQCFNVLIEKKVRLQDNPYKDARRRVASKGCSIEPIRILAADIRPYVLNGDKKRSFVGLARFYGAPITVNAKNGILAAQIVAGGTKLILEEAIPDSQAWGINDESTFEQIADKFGITEKMILIEFKEWKVDSPGLIGKTAFHYDLKATVKSSIDGTELATNSIKGKEVVKSPKLVEQHYAYVLESLLNSEQVQKAIFTPLTAAELELTTPIKLKTIEVADKQNSSAETVIEKNNSAELKAPRQNQQTCSVTQVLKMSDMGLSESQIEAACAN